MKGSGDANTDREVVSKSAEVGSINVSKAESKWGESVLEECRGALVKARLALQMKREKKKEQHVKSTLARLRKMADAATETGQVKVQMHNGDRPERPPLKRKPLAGELKAPGPAVPTENPPTIIPKKARTTFESSHAKGEKQSVSAIRFKTPASRARTPSKSTPDDLDANKSAGLERKDDIRNNSKERRKEDTQNTVAAGTRVSQGGASRTNEVDFSFKRPSVDDLRDFAKKARC